MPRPETMTHDDLVRDAQTAHLILSAAGLSREDELGMPLSVAGRLRRCTPPLLLGALVRRDATELRRIAAYCGAYADELAQGNAATSDLDDSVETEWDRWAAASDKLSAIAQDLDHQWSSRSVNMLIDACRRHLELRSENTTIDIDQRLCSLAERVSGRPVNSRAEALIVLLGEE